MASVSWTYPASELLALKKQRAEADVDGGAVADTGINIEQLKFRYRIEGDAPWRPLRVFDDGAKVYIQFPSGLAQSEAPPLFVIGPDAKPALVNYRVRGTTYIVDRLFAAAELRLGTAPQRVVRIVRTDAVWRETTAMTDRDQQRPGRRPGRQGRARDAGAAGTAAARHAHQPQGADRRRRGPAVASSPASCCWPSSRPACASPARRSSSTSSTSRSPTRCRSCPPPTTACKPEKKTDAGKELRHASAGRAPAAGAAPAIRSPRRSASRRPGSHAWPARPARVRVFFRLQLKAAAEGDRQDAEVRRRSGSEGPAPIAADGGLTTLIRPARRRPRAGAGRRRSDLHRRTITRPTRRASSPS